MRNTLGFIICLALSGIASASGEDDGHLHGPDGRHIVTSEAASGQSSFILSHHDMRVEGPDGKSILNVVVNSTITHKDRPNEPIHTEKNVYEPENEVYGSHLTYSEPGEYVLKQDVEMPDGKKLVVAFPVYVPAIAAPGEAADEHAHGPNYIVIGGGILAGIVALFLAFRMGKKSAAGALALVLVASLLPAPVFAQEDEEGHLHGPDGRHIVTETTAKAAAGSQLRAYPTPDRGETATQTVDGIKFVLSIENEEMLPDPGLISVSATQADIIGLQTAKAELSASAAGLQTTGRVSANPNGVVKVNARAGGRITRLGALPGTEVRKGQVLAVIESPELADAQAAIRTATAELAHAKAGVQVAQAGVSAARAEMDIAERELARQKRLAAAGEFASPTLEAAKNAVSEAEARAKTVQAEVERLKSLLARQQAGVASGVVAQREADLTASELVAARADLADHTAQLQNARTALVREESIARQGLRNAKEIDAAQARLDLATSAMRTARSRHTQALADIARVNSAIRVASDQVRLLGGGPGGGNQITLTAPIDAEVEHRFVTLGQTVATGELLYDLLNADLVWIMAEVYEKDIPKVRVGQRMEVVADAYPDRVYEGRVAFIHNEVNPQSRTTQVRVVIENAGERLKQDMFVRVVLGTGDEQLVTVPTSAVQRKEGLDYVFVQEKEGVYRQTLVQVLKAVGNRSVVKGVEAGRVVATSGSYQLLSLGGGQ